MMVSQKFMVILHQQPHYNKPTSTSNSSTISNNVTISNDVQNTLEVPKKSNTDNSVVKPNTSSNVSVIEGAVLGPLLEVKIETELEGNTSLIDKEKDDIIIKEESNNKWISYVPDTGKGNIDNVLSLDKTQKHDSKRKCSESQKSLPHLIKNEQILRPPSKRIRREKIVYDPSTVSSFVDKKETHKICKVNNNTSCISEKSKTCSKPSREKTEIELKEHWEGNLTCDYCGKYMQRSDYLRLHLMKHTGETPHKCPYCKNGYRARWRLVQHLRTHTRNLPYHCPYCNYRGNRSDYLTSHINRIHKKRKC